MKVSPAHGGQLVGGQAARQRLAQRQVGVPGHGRRRLGAEPDLIQQVALAPVPFAAGQRQEEEPADILPRPDRVVAAVDAPLVVAVGDLTADHEAADGDLPRRCIARSGPAPRAPEVPLLSSSLETPARMSVICAATSTGAMSSAIKSCIPLPRARWASDQCSVVPGAVSTS